jgi:hypothetical protein
MGESLAKLYRLREPKVGWEFLTASEFAGALFPEEACNAPEDPDAPEGEWYCHNEDCDVREVRVSLKYLDAPPPRPPEMLCPLCGGPLVFHNYLRTLTLVQVRQD